MSPAFLVGWTSRSLVKTTDISCPVKTSVQNDDAGLFSRGVQGAHRLADIRGGDHLFALGDTFLGNGHVVDVGQQADYQISLPDQFFQRRAVAVLFDVVAQGRAVRVALHQFLSLHAWKYALKDLRL